MITATVRGGAAVSKSVTLRAVPIRQVAPSSVSITTGDSATFRAQLVTTGNAGAVTFVTSSSDGHLAVSGSGTITTVDGPLAAGSYAISGTDRDAFPDRGIWSYSLRVLPITQSRATNGAGDDGRARRFHGTARQHW